MNKIIRNLVLSTVFCLAAAAAMAVPAQRIQQRIRLTDGSEITATLRGDERVSYYETSNGALYIRQADGLYRPTSQTELQLRMNDMLQKEHVQEQMRLAVNPKANVRRRAPRKGESLTDAYIGSKKGLVILVNFKDKSFADANPQPFYDRMFNEKGFTDDGQTGSVHDYYYDQSYGKFDLTFDVVGPITLSQPMKYYGGPEGDVHDSYNGLQAMVKEACQTVDGQVNFAEYDWNKDGYADQVYIIYAGYGQATGGDENTIWPHKSFVQNGPTLDNTIIGTYACNNELSGKNSGTERMGIGTACHEFSHCLGLPDFYNTNDGSGGGGEDWDIMSGGNYNGGGKCPAGYTSYERWLCGWLAPIELDKPTTVTDMPSLEAEPTAYILTHDTYENEYYLLENRQPTKWDKETGGKGLLIFHVDYDPLLWLYNLINNDPAHERMALVAADGDTKKDPSGDPFPGPSGLKSTFTDNSNPAADLYNPMPDGTLKLGKPIEKIQLTTQGTISFVALDGMLPRTENATASDITANGFTLTWDPVEGAESYDIFMQCEQDKHATPQEGLVLLEDFKGCVSSKVGFSNIGTTMDKYTTVKGWSGKNLYQSPTGLQIGKGSNMGTLLSPTLPESVNKDITIVLWTSNAYGSNQAAQAKVIIHTQDGTLSGSFTNNGRVVIPTQGEMMPKGEYTVEVQGLNVMAISKLAVIDGLYEKEVLNDYLDNLTSAAPAPKKAQENTTLLNTTDTKYTFTELNPQDTYRMRVMAIGAKGKGLWSNEVVVNMKEATAIQGVKAESHARNAWFDMQGHRLSAKPTRSGIYIHNGRKIMVK